MAVASFRRIMCSATKEFFEEHNKFEASKFPQILIQSSICSIYIRLVGIKVGLIAVYVYIHVSC